MHVFPIYKACLGSKVLESFNFLQPGYFYFIAVFSQAAPKAFDNIFFL